MIQLKDKNYAYFHNIMLSSVSYDIQVRAHSKGGTTVTDARQTLNGILRSYWGKSNGWPSTPAAWTTHMLT